MSEDTCSREVAPLRIVHVVASVEQEASGPSYSVPRLARELAKAGSLVELHSIGDTSSRAEGRFTHHLHRKDFAATPLLSRMYASRALRRALQTAAPVADVVHGHGLWRMPNIYPAHAARKAGVPFVLSPRGTLAASALKFSQKSKSVFWALLQGSCVRGAALMHATGETEYADVRALGLRQPVAVIPNGIDISSERSTGLSTRARREALYLGRLHPIKGVDRLIEAWSRLEQTHPDWHLRIVGPSEAGYGEQLAAIIAGRGLQRVELCGALFGAEKAAAYERADLFVLPTLNENFAMTVAEALAAGTPVICTKGAPWPGLEAHHCGWWIDHGPDALTAALAQAMALPRDELRSMGARGQDWMARDFTWESVATKMHAVYAWLSKGGDVPAWVRRD